jgi:hypothetical protein
MPKRKHSLDDWIKLYPDLKEIEREFNEYLLMDSPENTNLSVIEYWK